MKLDSAIADVQQAEQSVADELRTIGERHAADADVYHVAHTLAARCDQQLQRLLPHAERYGAPDETETGETPPVVERLRRMTSGLLGTQKASGQLLLEDLRDLYPTMHGAELAWTILLQAAKTTRDRDLVATARLGREEAERRWKWVRARVKETAPQVLVAG